MKKLPMIVALGAASLCSIAAAQNVQVYGRLYPFMMRESGSGASATGTAVSTLSPAATGTNAATGITAMSAGNSNLGFRGSEDLGDGLKATYQLEGVVAIDDGGATVPYRFGRNTWVGLEGKFGTVRLGNMDTVFKEYGDTLGMLGVSSGTFMSTSDVLRKTGFGTNSASSFHLRRTNSVQYQSMEIGGFQFGAQWSSNEAPVGVRDPKVISVGVKYDMGPFYFALAHEIHDDLFGGSRNAPGSQSNFNDNSVSSKDKATEFVVEWRPMKGTRIEFDIVKKEYKENPTVTGRFQSYKNTAYLLAMDTRVGDLWRIGAHFVKASAGSCSRLNAACSTDGLNGTKMSLGVAYYVSKRTYLFGDVDQIRNGRSARYSNVEFDAPNPGEDIRHIAFGISHGF
jgi:predicted porin